MSIIKFKRGIKNNLPTLNSGEPAFTTDTNQMYIGNGTSNVEFGSTEISTPTLLNSWSNVNTLRVSRSGKIVNISGVVQVGTPTVGTNVFQLPTSCIPSVGQRVFCPYYTTLSNATLQAFDITTSGYFTLEGTVVTGGFVSVNVSFAI